MGRFACQDTLRQHSSHVISSVFGHQQAVNRNNPLRKSHTSKRGDSGRVGITCFSGADKSKENVKYYGLSFIFLTFFYTGFIDIWYESGMIRKYTLLLINKYKWKDL